MLVRGIAANYLGTVWSTVATLAVLPVYVAFLGVEAYGLIGVHATLLAFAALTDLGVTPAFNREVARLSVDEAGWSQLRSFARSLEITYWILTAMLTAAAVAFLTGPTADWLKPTSLDRDEVVQILGLMFVQIGLQLVVGFYTGGLLGLQQHVAMNLITAVTMTLRLAGAAAVVAFLSPTLQALFVWLIAATLMQAAALAVSLHAGLPAGPSGFHLKYVQRIWRYAGGVTAVGFLSLLLMQVDKLILSRFLTLPEFGLYSLATTLALSFCKTVGPLSKTLLPAMTQSATRGDEIGVARVYRKGSQLASLLVVPITAVVSLNPRELVSIAFPDADVQLLAPLVTVLALGYACNALMSVPYMLTLAYGWVKFAGYQNLIACVAMLPLTYYLVDSYGAIGGAFAWLSLMASYVSISMYFLHRRLLRSEYVPWYTDNLLPAILSAFGVTLLLRELVPLTFGHLWNSTLLAAIYGVAIIATALSLSQIRSRILAYIRRPVSRN